jgi:hypothetical protein
MYRVPGIARLAGCCASGVDCTASAPVTGVAWDRLGPAPEENAVSNDIAPGKLEVR